MKYAFILAHHPEFRLCAMLRVFGVSRSGYHAWRARHPHRARRAAKQEAWEARVRTTFDACCSRYGSPRLTHELRAQAAPVSERHVAETMRNLGLRARAARRYMATTNSNHALPVSPNLLNQDFTAETINRKWVGDITYLWTEEGWLYLATMIDVYSRAVIGWSMASEMTAELACSALRMALTARGNPTGVIVHSDRGSQYCSHAYQDLIAAAQLRGSMSAKGNCYDNAMAESFFHSLKVEDIHGRKVSTRAEMRAIVFEYIEVFYNRTRRHSAIGNISPEQFEAQQLA